ncbi:MAG: GlsB/YeaQ/YmgE family stress response membrane protein [Mesorhizobium sp.]|nr:MAG: GlsB/YeaQ/YmgE family stress response membrane protein [Mesorhizobium sp.]
MGIISWIILGLIAGFIGSKIVNKTGQGMIMDIVLGIVGVTGLNIWSLIVAVIGSIVVLWAYHQISGKRTL